MVTPAQVLEGLTLRDDWVVGPRIQRSAKATGGFFSESYIVEKPDGERAFLKALDVSGALMSNDFTKALERKLSEYNFERDLLDRCNRSGLDRIVRSITYGQVDMDPPKRNVPVPYLIFELADGDIRSRLDLTQDLDLTWVLRSIHQFTVGVRQLHGIEVSHQDLKPSNIFDFGVVVGAKVGDLGRAVTAGGTMPHEQLPVAGAWPYAPPELLYGYTASDWSKHRFGCDLYQIGSLVTFMFCKVTMNGLLLSRIAAAHQPSVWTGSYVAVLPHIRDAYDDAMDEFESQVPPLVREGLTIEVRRLCEPDPDLRGHPSDLAGPGSSYSLERFVSRFDLLATRARLAPRPTNS